MFRILGCRNIAPIKKLPDSLLKTPNVSKTALARYQTSGQKKKSGHPILYTLGFTTLTLGGVVAYAKFDSEFRLWLEENLPGSDKFIELVTVEKGVSIVDVAVHGYENIKNDTLGKIEDLTGFKFESESSSAPSTSSSILSEKSSSKQDTPTVGTTAKPSTPASKASAPVELKSFADLEQKLHAFAKLALDSYKNGAAVLSRYDNQVVAVIDQSVEKTERSGWAELSKLKEETHSAVAKIETDASDALKSLQSLKAHIGDAKFEASADQINTLRQHVNTALAEVQKAQAEFEIKKSRNNLTEKYASRVQEEKRKHQEELEILFPNMESYEKDPALKNLNLLLLYTSNKIQYYQKELAKLEMQYLRSMDKKSGADDSGHVEKLVEIEVSKEKRNLTEEFQKKALELQALFEKDIRTQLKRQAEAHSDHLNEALHIKQAEVDTRVKRDFESKLLAEKAKYQEHIGVMIGRMKAFEEAFKKRAHTEAAVQSSQALWSSCQALMLRISNSTRTEDVKPLRAQVDAIKKSAAKSDTFVETICAAFPSQALSQGVYNEQALRDRFLNVQDSAYRVALVPETGASLPLVFLSYLQSFFIIRGIAAISPEEVRDEPSSKLNHLNTYEILERARYFVDRNDLLQAVKYLNLLEGGSKAVCQQWIKDTLVYLETETAAKALLSHAASVSFVN